MRKYIQSSILGVIAVAVLDGLLIFSGLPPMFGFFLSELYMIPARIGLGVAMGATLQYFRDVSKVNKEQNVHVDLRYMLGLLVYSMFVTYAVTIGMAFPYFPEMVFILYFLSVASFSASLTAHGHPQSSSWWQKIMHTASAGILGLTSGLLFWHVAGSVLLLSNPLAGQLWLWGLIGAAMQVFIVSHLFEYRLNLGAQWGLSLGSLSIAMGVLFLTFQPYMALYMFTTTALMYGMMRAYACKLPEPLSWHPMPAKKSDELPNKQGKINEEKEEYDLYAGILADGDNTPHNTW